MQNNLTDWLTFNIWVDQQFNQITQKKLNSINYKKEFKPVKKINLIISKN
jgi:hypothetical protein